MSSSRRNFVKNAGAGLGLLSLPNLFNSSSKNEDKKLKVVCVGGHPDDPESGCGGTLARFVNAGHEVTILYLTSGEAGIPGKSNKEAATIRTKEATEACKILQAKPVFVGQIDGATIVSKDWMKKLQQLITAEAPHIVFTHWPIDSHPDHQAASLLTIQTWMRTEKPFDLYFFEVCQGGQTMTFRPTDIVDISSTQEQKKKAVYCHTSQDPNAIYNDKDCNHALMERFRGAEIGVTAGEGFVRMTGRNNGKLI